MQIIIKKRKKIQHHLYRVIQFKLTLKLCNKLDPLLYKEKKLVFDSVLELILFLFLERRNFIFRIIQTALVPDTHLYL